MYNRNPSSGPCEPSSPFILDGNGRQNLTNVSPMYPDQQNPGFCALHSQAATHHVETHASHQLGPIPLNSNNLPSHHQHVMMWQHHQQVPSPLEVPNTVHNEPQEGSMSYYEAIDLVKELCPEALRAIKAAHFKSTRPVILTLQEEIIFLKHLLQYCNTAVPNLVDPVLFQNLYAEQPEGYPLPVSRSLLYGRPYAPISSASSDSSSPMTPVSITPSTPPPPYDSRNESTPPRMPLYTAPAAMGPATMHNDFNGGMSGPFDVANEGIMTECDGGPYESFHSA